MNTQLIYISNEGKEEPNFTSLIRVFSSLSFFFFCYIGL